MQEGKEAGVMQAGAKGLEVEKALQEMVEEEVVSLS